MENTLHKVHRHFFEHHSEHFKKLLSTYWFSPTSHLFLAEIKKTEFEMLLSIFYPTLVTPHLVRKITLDVLLICHLGISPSPISPLSKDGPPSSRSVINIQCLSWNLSPFKNSMRSQRQWRKSPSRKSSILEKSIIKPGLSLRM